MTGHRTEGHEAAGEWEWEKLNMVGTQALTGKDRVGRWARAWRSAA